MFNRGNVLLALGVFGAVFCVTFWRDTLFQGVGQAMENAPPEARTSRPLSTTVDVKFQRAKPKLVEMGPNGEIRDEPSQPSGPEPRDTTLATLVAKDGRNRLCENIEDEFGGLRMIIDYDATHYDERQATKFSWRASGCDEAIRTRGETMTNLAARKRIVALVPRTEAYAEDLRIQQGVIKMIEHPNS